DLDARAGELRRDDLPTECNRVCEPLARRRPERDRFLERLTLREASNLGLSETQPDRVAANSELHSPLLSRGTPAGKTSQSPSLASSSAVSPRARAPQSSSNRCSLRPPSFAKLRAMGNTDGS